MLCNSAESLSPVVTIMLPVRITSLYNAIVIWFYDGVIICTVCNIKVHVICQLLPWKVGAIASICSFTHSSGEGRQSGKVQVQVSWYCGGRTWLDSHLWYSVQQNRLPKEIQWNLSNMDTLGTKMIVLISDQGENMKLGFGQLFCLTRCPHFTGVLLRAVPL